MHTNRLSMCLTVSIFFWKPIHGCRSYCTKWNYGVLLDQCDVNHKMSKIGDASRNRDKNTKDPTLRMTKLMSRKRLKVLSDISNWNDDIPYPYNKFKCILSSSVYIDEISRNNIQNILKWKKVTHEQLSSEWSQYILHNFT